jgi:uncharacterized membrane protein YfcA
MALCRAGYCLFIVALALWSAAGGVAAHSDDELDGVWCDVPNQWKQCELKVCNASHQCVPCTDDAQCYFGIMACDRGTGECYDNSPLHANPVALGLGLTFAIVVCSIGVVAGVGGGAILTPLYAGLIGMPSTAAVIGSLATITGQGLVNVPVVVTKWHPYHARGIVNYQLLALWYPVTAAGSTVGTIISPLFPAYARGLALVVIQAVTAARVWRHARKAKEGGLEKSEPPPNRVEEPRSKFERRPIIIIAAAVTIATLCKSFMEASECGGFRYWLIAVSAIVAFVYLYALSGLESTALSERVSRRLMPASRRHFDINRHTVAVLPATCFLAGFCSTTMGIGGATLVNPLFLSAGLVPEEVSATGGLLTFCVALQSTVAMVAVNRGELPVAWLITFAAAGVASTFLGRFLLMPFCRRFGAQYMIVVMMMAMLGIGVLVIGAFTIKVFVDMKRYDQGFELGELCVGKG